MVERIENKYAPKGWGFELILANNDLYCGKLLYFIKGKRYSFLYHLEKDKTFYVHKGELEVRYLSPDEWVGHTANMEEERRYIYASEYWDRAETVILKTGDTLYVPPRTIHTMLAMEPTELFEFSTTHYDEDNYMLIKGD